MMPSWIVPGGLRGDLPDGFELRLRKFLKEFPAELEVLENLLVENPIWKQRTQNIGVLTPLQVEEVLAFLPFASAELHRSFNDPPPPK